MFEQSRYGPTKGLSAAPLAMLVLTAAIIAVAMTRMLAAAEPPTGLVIAGGVGSLALLLLALLQFDVAVLLAFVLLAIVFVEPAPSDIVFVVVIAVAAATGQLRFDQFPFVVGASLAVFLALNLVSFVDVIDLGGASRFFAITAYLILLAVWLTGYVRSRERARIVAGGYVVAAVTMSAAASLALYIPFPGNELLTYAGRAQGLFKDPNVFGPFLVPALLILIEEVLSPRLFRLGAFTKLAAISVLAVGLLLSYSRGAWLNVSVAIAVMLFVLLLRRGGSRRALTLLSVLTVAGVTLVSVVALTDSTAFIQERAGSQSYDVDRFGAQRSGIALAAEHPVGVGPGQADVIIGRSTHSLYVRSLAEQGIIGLATILLLVTLTLFLAVRNVWLGRDTYGAGSAALLAAWCGLIASSLFVDTLHWRHLWIVAALIWVGATRPQRLGQMAGR